MTRKAQGKHLNKMPNISINYFHFISKNVVYCVDMFFFFFFFFFNVYSPLRRTILLHDLLKNPGHAQCLVLFGDAEKSNLN